MPLTHYDILYASGAALASPYWLLHPRARRKVFTALHQRMGRVNVAPATGPAVLIHAVSLGEMNATRTLVAELRHRRPGLRFVLSTTTQTGFDRGSDLYRADSDVSLIRYPLDFTAAVERTLDATRPSVVVLMELEVWPNFVNRCARRNIPVLLINGRLTPISLRRYRLVQPLLAATFRRLRAVCVQDHIYRDRFISLGCDPTRVTVTGTMKFDTAALGALGESTAAAETLAKEMGLNLDPTVPILVAGSTGPGEEAILLDVYRRLLPAHPNLRLIIVPRKPERFDEVATLIRSAGFPILRRSQLKSAAAPLPPSDTAPVILGDTMGELRTFYALATVVFVGRTLVDLGPRQHGSDMIEPAALAKPVIVGPHTANFADAMRHLRRAGAVTEVTSADELTTALERFLHDPALAAAAGQSAREIVQSQQGATQRHADAILAALDDAAR